MPRPRPTTEKRCPDCKETKSAEEFYQSEKYDGGLSPYCKPCARARNRGRSPELQEKIKAAARASYHRNKERNREHISLAGRKRREQLRTENPADYRAKKFFDVHRKDVAPDISREYLAGLFATVTHCQCCSKRLHLEYEPRAERQFRSNPDAPSIDRVDNRRGYTRDNIAVICWQCNFRKTDLTLEDLQMFLRYIEQYGGRHVV